MSGWVGMSECSGDCACVLVFTDGIKSLFVNMLSTAQRFLPFVCSFKEHPISSFL